MAKVTYSDIVSIVSASHSFINRVSLVAGYLGRSNASDADKKESRELTRLCGEVASRVEKIIKERPDRQRVCLLADDLRNAADVYEGLGRGNRGELTMWLITDSEMDRLIKDRQQAS